MTRKIRILRTVLMVIVVLLIAVQLFLMLGLTPIIKKYVIPAARDAMKVDVDVGKATANILGGKVYVSHVTVGNPEGFSEPEMVSLESAGVNVAVLPSMSGRIRISNVDVRNASLTIERNAENAINLLRFLEGMPKPETQEPAPTETPAETAGEPGAMPKLALGRLSLTTSVKYVDYYGTNQPYRTALNIEIEAADIKTYGDSNDKWGVFTVTSQLEGRPELFAADISGRIAPVTDPLKASFEVEGHIASIDTSELGPMAEGLGITTDSMSVDLIAKCRDGVFIDGSSITVHVRNAQLTGKMARKFKALTSAVDLTFPVMISGTIEKPYVDWIGSLAKALIENVSKNLNNATKALEIDKKVDKAMGGAGEFLGNFLGGGKKKK